MFTCKTIATRQKVKKTNFKHISIVLVIILVGVICAFWWQNRISISVIIPVYNAERDLSRCLNSVFKQKGRFEVIAVNDGSTDSSLNILEEYKKKYSNLTVINQTNQGVSAARNKGLSVAKNKYITFVDSDDWIEPDTFELVEEMIKKDDSDIVLTGFYDVYDREWVRQIKGEQYVNEVAAENRYPDRNLDKLALFSPFYGKDAHSDLYYANIAVHGNFFKKSFLDKYQIIFPKKINLAEDYVFMFRAYLNNPFISIVKKPLYNYHNRTTSLSKSQKMLFDSREALECMKQTSEYQNTSRRKQIFINDSWLGLTLLGIANLQRYNNLKKSDVEEAYKIYKTLSIYNLEELKFCRNHEKLKLFFRNLNFNHPL